MLFTWVEAAEPAGSDGRACVLLYSALYSNIHINIYAIYTEGSIIICKIRSSICCPVSHPRSLVIRPGRNSVEFATGVAQSCRRRKDIMTRGTVLIR